MTTTLDTIAIPFTAVSGGRRLSRIVISVNGVPVDRLAEADVGASDSVRRTASVRLLTGTNRIQVSAMNEAGVRGPAATIEVNRDGTDGGELYVAAIGVNTYTDSRLNLQNAVGDAEAILAQFRKNPGPFHAVYTWTIPERRATRDEIGKLADWLADAREEDQVILFFTGHGFLDERLNYYFGTIDIDPRHPADAGLSYDRIESLLAMTRARRKLLVLDSCYSGENDAPEETVLRGESPQQRTRIRGFKGFPTEIPVHIGLEDSFQLMRHVFADIREGTGAEVIAAAGGLEVTVERSDTRHSPLTTALLEALAEKRADTNGDGTLTVSELRDYITDRVPELSGDRQHAVARRESSRWDFPVY